ncbi:MAG TPA: amino acid--[acyl-carrier-protein] ligase [Candidatus Binataceae bacterium]|nr:amino acid--[acyl-carrier-protein] ligase [Candidatus Binataceae bacterium]
MDVSTNDRLDEITQALFKPTGVAGVYARTALFERVIEGLSVLISRERGPDIEVLRFPPVMSRKMLEVSGYLQSFPHLLGCVSCLSGNESEIRMLVDKSGWISGLAATDLVLSPAACYPVYPLQAAQGVLPAEGRIFDVAADCFRHEATHEPGRLQSFRMREYVFMGTPEQALDFRKGWMPRAERLAKLLCLPYTIAPASDPFFGRAGKLAALTQLEQSLKFELLIPMISREQPTACMSFNYHRNHFGSAWALLTSSGDVAHTACVAFGLDRLALAIFATHGMNPQQWPASVRDHL